MVASLKFTSEVSEDAVVTAKFEIKNPKYWWTRNFGDPHMYELDVRLFNN